MGQIMMVLHISSTVTGQKVSKLIEFGVFTLINIFVLFLKYHCTDVNPLPRSLFRLLFRDTEVIDSRFFYIV